MIDLNHYKERKLNEAFETEEKTHDQIDEILRKEQLRINNGSKRTLTNKDLLNMIVDMGNARKSTRKAIKKYK